MIIQDGTNNGYAAKVDADNRLLTRSRTVSDEHVANEHGDAYAVTFSQSPTAAGDCIFYMVNSSDTKNIIVHSAVIGAINVTADDTFYFKIGDTGTRNSGTALTPVNLNGGSGTSADGTFEYGADLDGGAATLAGGSTIYAYVLADVTDLTSKVFNFEQDIILPKNKTLTMWVGGSATGTFYVTFDFYYAEITDA